MNDADRLRELAKVHGECAPERSDLTESEIEQTISALLELADIREASGDVELLLRSGGGTKPVNDQVIAIVRSLVAQLAEKDRRITELERAWEDQRAM